VRKASLRTRNGDVLDRFELIVLGCKFGTHGHGLHLEAFDLLAEEVDFLVLLLLESLKLEVLARLVVSPVFLMQNWRLDVLLRFHLAVKGRQLVHDGVLAVGFRLV
jgi:hypothetical protein